MTKDKQRPVCGVVMPISALDGCDEPHWIEVLSIVSDAIDVAGFEANIVSNADDVGIIQKRIIQNLYENPIVVCDVSGKNPNVMFELGLRLAFDKPTIIIKDDKTAYSFDTAPIEHLEYPRDLRFSRIVEFKEILGRKIKSTYERSREDPDYTTFLKNFGEFTVAKVEKREVSEQQYIFEELKALKKVVQDSYRIVPRWDRDLEYMEMPSGIDVCARDRSPDRIEMTKQAIESLIGVKSVLVKERNPGHSHILIRVDPESDVEMSELRAMVRRQLGPRIPRKVEPVEMEASGLKGTNKQKSLS